MPVLVGLSLLTAVRERVRRDRHWVGCSARARGRDACMESTSSCTQSTTDSRATSRSSSRTPARGATAGTPPKKQPTSPVPDFGSSEGAQATAAKAAVALWAPRVP